MKLNHPLLSITGLAMAFGAAHLGAQPPKEPAKAPPIVTPCPAGQPAAPPSDAVVLFDGSNLDKWEKVGGGSAAWRVADGAAEVVPGAGNIRTRQSFGDAQIHVEFRSPTDGGEGQGRGNSGVYIQSKYEVQVLDSYKNDTYPDGQCGAVYGQHIPLVNVCRAPGEWQTYDIVFRSAVFNAKGERTAKARVTVFHNGVLIQDNVEINGPTGAAAVTVETPGDGPIMLQEHGNKVQYRNVWVRELGK